jgi:hypothetical protein
MANGFLLASTGFSLFPWVMEQKLALSQESVFTGLGVGLFKLMDSVENTKKCFIAMNEALKKEAAVYNNNKLDIWYHSVLLIYYLLTHLFY